VTRATACVLTLITCVGTPSLAGIQFTEPRDTRAVTLRELDNAVRLLGRPGSDYKKILQGTLAGLPPNADERVPTELRRFLARVPQPGPEYQCSEDFTRARAQDVVWRLRDTLLGIQTLAFEPTVCYAIPFAVDLTRAQATSHIVDIYGYDFDAASLQLIVITRDGFVDVTSRLSVKSHTHLTVTVGEGGIPASATNQSLALAWGHVIHYSVPLVGPTTSLCSSKVETITAGKTVSRDADVDASNRRHAAAVDVAHLRLDYSSNLLEATLCVTTADAAGSGCVTEFLYTTDPDRVIEGVFGPLSSDVLFDDGRRPSNVRMPRGPVRQWGTASRRSPHVAADSASVVAQLDEIRIVSSDVDSCISPIAYVEAKRTTAFTTNTRQTLDAQLRTIDRAIVTLRPRFAPPIAALAERRAQRSR
jgi:hypothetical protein